jgi:hypothetical protein
MCTSKPPFVRHHTTYHLIGFASVFQSYRTSGCATEILKPFSAMREPSSANARPLGHFERPCMQRRAVTVQPS